MSHQPKIGPGKPLPSGPLDLNALTPKPLHAEQGDPKQILQYCAGGVSVISAVLNEAGSSLSQVVKTTIFLKDMNDFAAVNEVYAEAFGEHRPARATVEVSRLPKDVLVEIDCIALEHIS